MSEYKTRGDVSWEWTEDFKDKRYRPERGPQVAYCIAGYEVEADDDTEWSGHMNRTGSIIAIMVGDDNPYVMEESELIEIPEDSYCGGCGQIGCGH